MRAGTLITSPAHTITAEVMAGGSPLAVYRRGDGYPYVPGTAGQSFAVRVRNLTSARVEVLPSVDGRSLLADEAAGTRDGRGLVIKARGEYSFTGWRLNDTASRDLVFGTPEGSVAHQATGSAAGVGVIGLAVWREAAPDYEGFVSFASASPVAHGTGEVLRGGFQGRGLGTHAGAEHYDPVGRTTFDRAPGGPEVIAIGYRTLADLEAMGITGPGDPDPFPADSRDVTGYGRYRP